MMKLSRRLRALSPAIASTGSPSLMAEMENCIRIAEQIEDNVDDRPKRRTSDPETSVSPEPETLRDNQRAVYTVFQNTPHPLSDHDVSVIYRVWRDGGYEMPQQSPSGLRTRRRELQRLGLLRVVDRSGTSPTGRDAQRFTLTTVTPM